MRNFFLLISLSLVFPFLSAQNTAIKSTDKYVEQVNTYVKENVFIKKELAYRSELGGVVTGYYLKNKLQLIVTRHKSEFGFIEYSFYVEKDSLLFVNERKVSLKEPVNEKEYSDYEKYVLFNTDKNGNTDLTKWPLTIDINNDYYLSGRKIIKYQLRNFGKPLKAGDTEIEETNKELIRRFTAHMEELKTE